MWNTPPRIFRVGEAKPLFLKIIVNQESVKAWGEPTNEIVIVTHGYKDNAGSFDRLIPILPDFFYYVCLDLPGHGFSSNFSDGLPIHYTNYLLPYKTTTDYFKRLQYILMGHSFGGQLGLLFAQLYPQRISKLILLDALYHFPLGAELYMSMILKAHDICLANNDGNKQPSYAYDEAIERVRTKRYLGDLTKEAAEDLTRRMVKKDVGGKYVFTTDHNLSGIIMPSATMDFNIELFQRMPIRCPVLILLTKKNEYVAANEKLRLHFEQVGFKIKYIEAKNWGDPEAEPVIVLHGHVDNAGSFDRLIPKLPNSFYYICVDLPGHGFSSPFDQSLPLHYVNFLLAVRAVANHFAKDTYVMMGHSFGATLCIMFTQLYPKKVSKLIMLDALYVMPSGPDVFLNNVLYAHKIYFELWKRDEKRTFSFEEVLEKIKKTRYPGEEGNGPAEDLAKRMVTEVESGRFVITADPQLKALILPSSTHDFNKKMLKERPVKCPQIILLTPDNSYNITNKPIWEYLEERGVDIRIVAGEHHVHQTQPESVLKHIVPFLNNRRSKC